MRAPWPRRTIGCLALVAGLALGAFAESPAAEGAGTPLDIAKAEELAGTKADEVVARNASAQAALKAADAARAQLQPRLGGSLTGAYLVNPPSGLSIPAGYLGRIPTGPTTYIPLPETEVSVLPATSDKYFKGNLTFSQPIYAWGKIRASIDLALFEAKVADAEAKGAARDAARQANRAYFSALLSERSADILTELCALAERIVADRRSALDNGLGTKGEVLSAAADLADLRSRLVEARESAKSSLEALAFYTGFDADRIELVSDFRDALPPIAEDSLKASTLLSSTAFAEAGARLSEADRKLDLERGSSLFEPDLSLFASLDLVSPNSGGSISSAWTSNLSLGLTASVDLFDGGASAARKKEAADRVDSAKAALLAAGKGARLEARRAVEAANKAQASLEAARARSDWAAEALNTARASAAEQLISRSELDGAEIREASERLSVLGARYALEESIADIERLSPAAAPAAAPGAAK
jgi:outer membrane protein TolC